MLHPHHYATDDSNSTPSLSSTFSHLADLGEQHFACLWDNARAHRTQCHPLFLVENIKDIGFWVIAPSSRDESRRNVDWLGHVGLRLWAWFRGEKSRQLSGLC